jgi:DNA-binding SARP family transcriptional activator
MSRPQPFRANAVEEGVAGALVEEVALLLDAGAAAAAVERLANVAAPELDDVDLADVDALLVRFPPSLVDANPRVRLLLARLCLDAVQIVRRTELLSDLRTRLPEIDADDPVAGVGVRIELARDLMRDGQPEAADALAAEVLELAGPDDLYARALACEVRGRAVAWWASSAAELAEARRWLEQGLAAAARLGSADLQAVVLGFLGYRVEFACGRLDDAARYLARAADVIAVRPRRRSMLLTFLAEVEHNRGRFDAAAAALDEAASIAVELADDRLLAYVGWERARGAGWQGRLDELHEQILAVRQHASDWFDHPAGMAFLAEMAELLDRNGDPVGAARYLGQAMERMTELGIEDPDVLLVAGAIEARHGDPERGLGFLDRVAAAGGLAPLRLWRLDLLRVLARARLLGRGRPGLAGEAAAAFEAAATAGVPDAPALIEPEATDLLAALAAAAGSTAARFVGDTVATRVQVLGEFLVTRSGVRIRLTAGQPVQLVKMVAANRGQMTVDSVVDALWPDESPENSRKLLRNVLSRLRSAGGNDLLVRDGDVLRFGDDVVIDLVRFDHAATRALALRGVDDDAASAHARIAVGEYRGELLPMDQYEDWAAESREAARGRYIALLRLLADVADRRGDVDEAVHHLQRAIDAEPLDVDSYRRLLDVLTRAGRTAAAERVRRQVEQTEFSLGVRNRPIR